MADHQHTTDLTPAEIADRIWERADEIDFCMFDTWDGTRQQSRPLSSRVRRDEHAIYFLVSATGHKNTQIEAYPQVNLAYADTRKMDFVSISGEAELLNDRARIAELWSAFDKAWWDSPEDPDIRLLKVTPARGELWDSPGRLVALTTMLTAAISGGEPNFGDNGTVQL